MVKGSLVLVLDTCQTSLLGSNKLVAILNVEKFCLLRALVNHVLGRVAAHKDVKLQQLLFIDTWKDRPPAEQLCHDATQAPHIYLIVVGQAQHYFRCSIEPGLHIGESIHSKGRGGAKINNFNSLPTRIAEHQVLRL